jgi:hypothetical protein
VHWAPGIPRALCFQRDTKCITSGANAPRDMESCRVALSVASGSKDLPFENRIGHRSVAPALGQRLGIICRGDLAKLFRARRRSSVGVHRKRTSQYWRVIRAGHGFTGPRYADKKFRQSTTTTVNRSWAARRGCGLGQRKRPEVLKLNKQRGSRILARESKTPVI